MAASVVINRHTGAATGSPAVGTTKTAVTSSTNRMACSDNPSDGTSNPIPIPTSATNNSWWVSTRLAVTSTGPANGINNIKWYSDGTSFGTGLVCSGNTAVAATGYTQATGTTVTGTTLNTSNYTALSGAPVDVTTFTSTVTKAVTGSLSAGATNQDFGDFFVYQLVVGSTASVGTMTARQLNFVYDET